MEPIFEMPPEFETGFEDGLTWNPASLSTIPPCTWDSKSLPIMALMFRGRKRPVGASWWMDETYIKVGGQ